MKKVLLVWISLITGMITGFGQTGSMKINQWLVAGSFTSSTTTDRLRYPFIDEVIACPSAGEQAGAFQWKPVYASFIDFTKQGFANKTNCTAYAFTYLYSPSNQLAIIQFGSDDGAAIWLNGAKIFERLKSRSFVENEDQLPVQLGKGWNRLLVKVDQGAVDWATACTLIADNIKIGLDRPSSQEMATMPAAIVTDLSVKSVGKTDATLMITINNCLATELKNVRCELKGSGLHGRFIIKNFSAGNSVCVPLNVPLTQLCDRLAKQDAFITVNSKSGTNEVLFGPTVAMDLLMRISASPEHATPEIIKEANEIASAIDVYGMKADVSDLVTTGLNRLATGQIQEVKPVLKDIKNRLVAQLPDLKSDSIYVVGHAHMDMNWLWPYNESVKMFHDNFRQVVAFMEQYPDYRFIQSQATIYQHIEKADPPLFEKIKKYVAEGRLELAGGMWTEGDANLSGGEALCRSFLLGQRYFLDKFGKTAHIGWLPDNFGHISQFPQLLKLAGCNYYYFFRCVPYAGAFWWIGPDSSRVLCYTNDTYNGEINKDLKNRISVYAPITHKMLHPTGVGDHGGGPSRKNIEMVHQLDATPKYPTIQFASVEKFFQSTAQSPVSLPVHRGEMQFIFDGCYTSVAEIKENTRKSEQSMYAAEYLSSIRWLSGNPYPADQFKNLWETVTFNQFHDILPGSAIYETYQDAVADHKMVQKEAKSIFDSDFRKFSDEIQFKTKLGQPIVVLNMQPRSGKVLVQAEVFSHEQPTTAELASWTDYYEYGTVKPSNGNTVATAMVTDGSGKKYPAQIIGGSVFPPGYRSTIEFVVDSMPAGGYLTFYADPDQPGASVEEIPQNNGLFKTDWFDIQIDMKTGDIIGLKDKRTGKEYVANGGRLNQLRIWMEAPNGMSAWTIGKTKEIIPITDVESVSIIEKGPVRATVEVVKKWGRSRFIQRTYIYKDYPRIDFDLEAHWFETGDGVHPAPFLKTTFDLAVDHPVFNCHVPFDVTSRPVTGQEVPAQQWVDVSDGNVGIALLNRTKFGHSFENGQLRLSLLRASYYPDIYPNIGKNRVQYSLFPHAGDWKNGVWAEGEKFNIPVYAAEPPSLALTKEHATRPESGSLISVVPAKVVMSGIKQAEDGKNLIIRLTEVCGEETEAVVTLPVAVTSARRVNIIELPMENVEQPVISGKVIKIKLMPHEIVTLSVSR